MRKTLLGVGLFIGLVVLSELSGYTLGTDREVTLDVALMLTPYGITKNLLFVADHELRPYYFSPVIREGVFDSVPLALSVVAVIFIAFFFLRELKRRRE